MFDCSTLKQNRFSSCIKLKTKPGFFFTNSNYYQILIIITDYLSRHVTVSLSSRTTGSIGFIVCVRSTSFTSIVTTSHTWSSFVRDVISLRATFYRRRWRRQHRNQPRKYVLFALIWFEHRWSNFRHIRSTLVIIVQQYDHIRLVIGGVSVRKTTPAAASSPSH